MTDFPDTPTLKNLQAYVAAVCAERGWDQNSDLETYLLFSEEVGELARAIRRQRNLWDEEGGTHAEVAEELADLLSYVLDLANRFRVDLEAAFRRKEELNQDRTWSQNT